jgi:hypothetical protein
MTGQVAEKSKGFTTEDRLCGCLSCHRMTSVPDKLPSAYTIHKQRQLDDSVQLVRRGSGSAYCPRDPKSDCTTAPEYTAICVIRGTLKDKP